MVGKLRSARGRQQRRQLAKIERNRNLELSAIYTSPPVRGKTQNTLMANLSISDKNKYEAITQEIDGFVSIGRRSNLEIGARLIVIRDEKLWRHGGHSNFEDYLEAKWHWTGARGSQLISGYEAHLSLPEEQREKLLNAGQASALAQVPEGDRSAVVDDATKDGKKLTAKKITASANKLVLSASGKKGAPNSTSGVGDAPSDGKVAQDAKFCDLDEGNNPIPAELQPEYTRNQVEIDEMLGYLSKVRGVNQGFDFSRRPR